MYVVGKELRPPSPFYIACLVIVVCCLAACGGGDGEFSFGSPSEPPPPNIEVENGTFELSSVAQYNGCSSAANFDGSYDVVIDSTTMTLGNWSGTWDPVKLTGYLESPHAVNTTRDCEVRTWTSVSVNFSSENAFWGSIVFRKRTAGLCQCCEQCTSSWSFTAARVTP
jgi:hypothetical protein